MFKIKETKSQGCCCCDNCKAVNSLKINYENHLNLDGNYNITMKGLVNLGNIFCLNNIIQVLFYINESRNVILNISIKK